MKVEEPGGHFDQLLRQTRSHHVMLSQIADRKANMLTTISAIAASILIALVDSPETRIPATIMLVTCVTTCCFAILASMPGMRRPRRDTKSGNPLFNPLFFGDFAGMDYKAYVQEMEAVMQSHETAYEAQIREVYAMGRYLATRKYLYLRRAYIVFFVGLVASAIAWLALQVWRSGVLGSL